MKIKQLTHLLWLLAILMFAPSVAAEVRVNLTPRPAYQTDGTGSYTLPQGMTVSASGLDAKMEGEVDRFISVLNAATDLGAVRTTAGGNLQVSTSSLSELGDEGYSLEITTGGISVSARTATGLYYAFQSIRKMLPANVLAGVKKGGAYTLPVVSIKDMPRYGYRGFMLDVSRHFFDVKEIKKMLDLMSFYKLNRFHFHLTDDQGWRMPVDKYPLLTTVGATAPNSRFTDMYAKTQYWINRQYGPYSYTKDELREIVAYAAERHIEIIPEVEFPGHMAAAMAAYPEFSCNPQGSHGVWSSGGISTDVLNVGNPAAVQFAKDILDEVIEIFPSEQIHIGGDECPQNAWESNAQCQALYQQLGLTNYRQLQSHFTNQLSNYVATKGRKLIVWNESITATGSDVEKVKANGTTVMCWSPALAAAQAAQAANIDHIYTSYVPFYINRKYSDAGIPGAGNGDSDPNVVYAHETPNHSLCKGIQATFWCEHVSDNDYLEFLALPRLMVMGEIAWTPSNRKNYADFQTRFTADKELLDLCNYKYNDHYMVGQTGGGSGNDVVIPEKGKYYRLTTLASDERKDRCIQLVTAGSSLIGTGNAQENRLWTAAQAAAGSAEYDAQFWTFVENPDNPGTYAMVNKAAPAGSVKGTPTAVATSGRWDYDPSQRHYVFTLSNSQSGGDATVFTLTTAACNGQFMNASKSGQALAVNVYNNPVDGNGGLWRFTAEDGGAAPALPDFTPLQEGKTYAFFSYNSEFKPETTIVDPVGGTTLGHATTPWAANAWTVASAAKGEGVQLVTLRNHTTGRFIGAHASAATGTVGYPVSLAESGAQLTLSPVEDGRSDLAKLAIGANTLWPVDSTSSTLPGIMTCGTSDSAYPVISIRQGSAWTIKEVKVYRFTCVDENGQSLGDFSRAIPADQEISTPESYAPAITNHRVSGVEAIDGGYRVSYTRTACTFTYECRDEMGGLVARISETVAKGSEYAIHLPEIEFYTLESSSHKAGSTQIATTDGTITAVYTTNALNGVVRRGEAVTELHDGKTYLIQDAFAGRDGFRFVNPEDMKVYANSSEVGGTPYMTWILRASGSGYKVQNIATDLYVPALPSGNNNPVSANGDNFTFSYSGGQWTILGSNGMYWNGNAGAKSLAGWNGPHPYQIFEYWVQPYFIVNVTCTDNTGATLKTTKHWVKAGDSFNLQIPTIANLFLDKVTGHEGIDRVTGHKNIEIRYSDTNTGVEEIQGDESAAGIYDLLGRKLERVSTPGLYIINGQKVLVK